MRHQATAELLGKHHVNWRVTPARRLSGEEINAMGLRPFVRNGRVDLAEVERYRTEKGLNAIRIGTHIDENSPD